MADQYFLARLIIMYVGIGIVALLGFAELFMLILHKVRDHKMKTRHTKK